MSDVVAYELWFSVSWFWVLEEGELVISVTEWVIRLADNQTNGFGRFEGNNIYDAEATIFI